MESDVKCAILPLTNIAFIAWCLGNSAAEAGISHPEIYAGGGTAGLNVGLGVKIAPRWRVRAEGDFGRVDGEICVSGTAYHGHVALNGASERLDWFLLRDGAFFLSIGAHEGGAIAKGSAPPTVSFDGHSYSLSRLGALNGKITEANRAGYVGFGSDRRLGPVGLRAEIGADIGRKPRATLAGPAAAGAWAEVWRAEASRAIKDVPGVWPDIRLNIYHQW